ncbi:MAG: hypothetical protein Q9195_006754 [Heterodermia aff. obscurata]
MFTAALFVAVALLPPSALSTGNFSSPQMDCKALANALPGRVFAPGSSQYETKDRSYFAAFENELSPACIVQPQSCAEMSTVIRTIASHSLGYLAIKRALSYFSAATGFVCDNVVNFEVVLASGDIVQANDNINRDLFLALKGGSNNFGVVTRFDLPTFKQGQIDFAVSSTPDELAHIIVATSWSAGAETGVPKIFCARPVAELLSLRPFAALQPQIFKSIRVHSLLVFAKEQSAFSTDGARQLYFTTSFRLHVQVMLEARELWLNTLEPFQAVPGLMLSLVFQPLTKGILFHSAQRGGNALGLTPDDGPLVITPLNSIYRNRVDYDKVTNAVLGLIGKIEGPAARRCKAARYRFTNYAYSNQRVFEGYGGRSVASLQAVSRNSAPSEANLDLASFEPQDVISKDVCIVGGGCSGVYTTIRLEDFDESVVVIEKRHTLGGHASTYTDPDTGTTLDIGVIVFGHLDEVKNYFARLDIALKIVPTSLGPPDHVDFSTGETVAFSPQDQAAVDAAFQRYIAELLKYPKLQDGFEMEYPIPEDLLLPFGDFVKKHSLDDLVTTVFAICQGYSSLLELSILYVLRYFNAILLSTLSRGSFMTGRNDVSVPMHELHHDRDFYRDPSFLDAFNLTQAGALAELKGNLATRATDPTGCSISLKSPQKALVTGGDTFLSFGYGKHSFPDPFFAVHEMELLLAHLVQHYEVEYLPKRPMQQIFMETKLPSDSATIRVPRRTYIA